MPFLSAALPQHRILACAISLTALLAYPAQAAQVEGDVTPLPWNSYSNVRIGNTSWGSLNIGPSTTVESFQADIGSEATGIGTATVTGAGSLWNTSWLMVGYLGRGTLTTKNGGTVSADSSHVGSGAGSSGTATVTGAGSHLSVAEFSVGFRGTGTLTIENGGAVSSSYLVLGDLANSNGTVNVRGTGSRLDTNILYVGLVGRGTLTIENGGLVTVEDPANFDFAIGVNGGSGVMQISNGFFAWQGDHVSMLRGMIEDGEIQYWNGSSYASLAPGANYLDFFKLEHVTNLTHSAFAGNANLEGLDGYTILTAVPEPSTYAAIFSIGVSSLMLLRRRRRA